MYIDFSGLFHQSSKDHLADGTLHLKRDISDWPDEWKIIEFKSYGRLPKITLPDETPDIMLVDALRGRASRQEMRGEGADISALGGILKYSCGVLSSGRRAQPSAGGRYPIEVYPLILRGTDEVPSGVYHYNVREHALDTLAHRMFETEEVADLLTYPWSQKASFVLVMTALFDRTQMKYGERGYRYILLEAGHIAQNMYLNAEAFKVPCNALGGTKDKHIESLLGIDGITESVVYTLVFG